MATNKTNELSKAFLLPTNDFIAKMMDLDKLLEQNLECPYTVGQRIQFYRKGYAEKGEKEPTLAINGTIKVIDNRRGWLHVEHRWGMAIVKWQHEKVNVLQMSKKDRAELDALEVEDRTQRDVFSEVYGNPKFTVVGSATGRSKV
jgi:hypothetical protein